MAEHLHRRLREEREFWDRRFDDEDASDTDPALSPPRREAGPTVAPPSPRTRATRTVALAPPDRLSDRAREWLRDRRHDPRAGVMALIVIAVIAGFVWYRVGVRGDANAVAPRARVESASAGAASDAAEPTTTSPTTPANAHIAVHVAGAVQHPGVVELGASARVIDAVEAVGGATAEGDLDRLNLAAKVSDGARIYVPKTGEADPGAPGTGASTGPGDVTGIGTPPPSPDAKVNLNTATQAQLEELPGIGPTYAQAIIDERTRRGGFTSVNELRSVRGIGDKRFADLAPLVTV